MRHKDATPIPKEYYGTYPTTVQSWSIGPCPSPAGTLVVPAPGSTSDVEYTFGNQDSETVTPSWRGTDDSYISFTVTVGDYSVEFTADSWTTTPKNAWSGTCSTADNPRNVQSGNWNANKSMATKHAKKGKKKVA